MKKVTLYIAQSLDGFVATEDGGVSWLDRFNGTGEDYGYNSFLDSIDTVVQGNTTFEQFHDVHKGKNSYVFSHNVPKKSIEGVTFVNGGTKKFVDGLDENTHQHIWLVGGPNLLARFLNENQVDEMIIFVMPVLLRKGIVLFNNLKISPSISLLNTKQYHNGVVKLNYKVIK